MPNLLVVSDGKSWCMWPLHYYRVRDEMGSIEHTQHLVWDISKPLKPFSLSLPPPSNNMLDIEV